MDFEGLGMAMGYNASMRDLQDRATQEILKGNAANAILKAQLAEAHQNIAELQGALAVESSFTAGARAQVRALKGELVKLDPENFLLRKTGKVYNDGVTHQTGLSLVLEREFDATFNSHPVMDGKGLNPEKFRPNVK